MTQETISHRCASDQKSKKATINLVDMGGGSVFNDITGRHYPTTMPTRQIRIRNGSHVPFAGKQNGAFPFERSSDTCKAGRRHHRAQRERPILSSTCFG
jgi:hypothetical protein